MATFPLCPNSIRNHELIQLPIPKWRCGRWWLYINTVFTELLSSMGDFPFRYYTYKNHKQYHIIYFEILFFSWSIHVLSTLLNINSKLGEYIQKNLFKDDGKNSCIFRKKKNQNNNNPKWPKILVSNGQQTGNWTIWRTPRRQSGQDFLSKGFFFVHSANNKPLQDEQKMQQSHKLR